MRNRRFDRRASTGDVRAVFDRRAPHYDGQIAFWERWVFGDGRQWACSRATGRTLEVAVGTGRNLPCYSTDVVLTGLELSFPMLAGARERSSSTQIALVQGDAQKLCFPDASFDAVVCTLSLSFIPDDGAAIREAHRVLRPAGRLIVVDHVRSHLRPIAWAETVIEPIWRRFDAGDHLTRTPLRLAEDVGFVISIVERSKLGIVERFVAVKS